MSPARTASPADQRARLLDAARRTLEEAGPEAVQARRLTSEVGASTQAVYTLFGGMPGLFEALVARGFTELRAQLVAVGETDDAVADHMCMGWAFLDWALAHPQLYRLMYGLTGGGLRQHLGLEMRVGAAIATFPEGQAAIEVLIGSVRRLVESGRIRPVDGSVAAGQFLSAMHGFVLLVIAGTFDPEADGMIIAASLSTNLLVGLGDDRAAVERSLLAAAARRAGAGS